MTQLSARPLPVRPADPVPRRRRGRWLLLGAVGVVTVLGLAIGSYLGRPVPAAHPADPSPSTRASLYPVPVVLSLDHPDSVLISWDPAAAKLPGFSGFLVLQLRPVVQPLARDLPGGTSSYRVDGLVPAQQNCYLVYAYGVTAAVPNPAPPPACVAASTSPTPSASPAPSRPQPTRSGTPPSRPRSSGASSPRPGCLPKPSFRGGLPCPGSSPTGTSPRPAPAP